MALVIIKYCLQVITCHDMSFPTPLVTVTVVVFNATFNNISVISWRSVLLVEETGENHRPDRPLLLLVGFKTLYRINSHNIYYSGYVIQIRRQSLI
jgi:hypothetical protein